MLSEKVKSRDTFVKWNTSLQALNTLDQHLTEQFVDTYKKVVSKANTRVIISYYEEIRTQLKRIILPLLKEFKEPNGRNTTLQHNTS